MAETGKAKKKGGLPTWVWIAGGGGVVLLVLLQRGGGGSSGGGDTSGLLASELSQALTAEREDVQSRLAETSARLELTLNEGLARQSAEAAEANELAAERAAALETSLFDRLLEALRGLVPTAPSAPSPAAPAPGAPPSGPTVQLPSAATIRAWEQGINLPEGWGFFFVDNFGRLPSSIAELESWRAQKAIPSGTGGWCIHWGGELKCL